MDISSFLQFRDVGRHIDDLETPVPVIDIDVVERNLSRWQERCDALGIANRPHIKTHKLSGLARYQIEKGARGITVQKLGEAEVMADAGISDMLLTFNVVGRQKLDRLAALVKRSAISVVADNHDMIAGLSDAARVAGRDITVLVECDTGAGRNGVQSPQDALRLAQAIDQPQGLRFGGLMTYTNAGQRMAADAFFIEARQLLNRSGLQASVVSTGGSPDMWKDDGLAHVTEYRAGTYIYFDRSLAVRGTCGYDDCALHVLTTVVSRPTLERALVDAGTKSLTSDLLGLEGYGVVHDLADAKIYTANEEHGYLDIRGLRAKPAVGDRLMITPNHVCPVVNLFDEVVFVRGTEVLGAVKVDARGRVQ
ncbi:MAG: alanine racemase [Proteobacteria bacterium]|nr:alanine racemase [Pseudomonadota bacterium]